jgi:hypothetical protein
VIFNGTRTVRLYGTYTFHGEVLTYYVPRFYYAPAFYGWAYYPWAVPAAFTWTWATSPWYAAYGPYFVVSPVYTGPYDWLTDYSLSQTLAAEYAQTAAAQAFAAQSAAAGSSPEHAADDDFVPPAGATYASKDTPIDPEVKQAIAQEVRQQLAAESNASSAQTGPNLSDVLQPHHVFVVDSDLNATTEEDETCNLSAGNVLQLASVAAPDSAVVDLIVMSSRRADCPSGTRVTLSLDSIAEMQNAFRARLDDGLAALRQQQGQNGLPAAPASAITPPPRPADYPQSGGEDAGAMLEAAQQQANQAETSVTSQAFATNRIP